MRERRAQRIRPAREGVDGWANFLEDRVAEESQFLRDVVAGALAMMQRKILDACKTLISEALAQRIKGTHDLKAKYNLGDVVAKDGASFIARRNDPGPCPGAGWQLLAKQGSRGVAGQRGAPGRDAPTIERWIVDRAALTVTPVYSNGNFGPVLVLGELFAPSEEVVG